MKKLLSYSTASLALLTASAVFAGGPEPLPPPPEINYFNGFFVGVGGSFRDTSFNTSRTRGELEVLHFKHHEKEKDDHNNKPPKDGTEGGGDRDHERDRDVNIFEASAPFSAELFTNGGHNTLDGYFVAQGGYGRAFNKLYYLGLFGFGDWGKARGTVTAAIRPGEEQHHNKFEVQKDHQHVMVGV